MRGEKQEERRGEGKGRKVARDRNERVQSRRSHLPSVPESTMSSSPSHQLSDSMSEASQEREILTFDQLTLPSVRSLTVTTSLPSVESLLSSERAVTSQPKMMERGREGLRDQGSGGTARIHLSNRYTRIDILSSKY